MAHALSSGVVPQRELVPSVSTCRTSSTPYHSNTRMFGTVPPLLKLLSTRMSPFESSVRSPGVPLSSCAVCKPVKVPPAFAVTSLWKNQKPICASTVRGVAVGSEVEVTVVVLCGERIEEVVLGRDGSVRVTPAGLHFLLILRPAAREDARVRLVMRERARRHRVRVDGERRTVVGAVGVDDVPVIACDDGRDVVGRIAVEFEQPVIVHRERRCGGHRDCYGETARRPCSEHTPPRLCGHSESPSPIGFMALR